MVRSSDSQGLGASGAVCPLSAVPPRADSAVCSVGACPALRELFRKSLGQWKGEVAQREMDAVVLQPTFRESILRKKVALNAAYHRTSAFLRFRGCSTWEFSAAS